LAFHLIAFHIVKSSIMRKLFQWDLGTRKIDLGRRTLLMGIVNVTPDSFSDGGLHLEPARAVGHALRLLDEGAEIVDIGGESTRPGAAAVKAKLELERILPVIEGVKRARAEAIVSVDTYKASVARSAVEAGAEIVNDVSGGTWDVGMLDTLADLRCGFVLMHMRGRPGSWRSLPPIGDAVGVVSRELAERAQKAAGRVGQERIVLDPGLGFGKSFEENYPLISHFEMLAELGYPLLGGASRKSFIGRMLESGGHDAPLRERLRGTLAVETALVLMGAHILRTHDVRASRDVVRVADAILQANHLEPENVDRENMDHQGGDCLGKD
jgi:dihydropteroate synthase